MDDPAKVQELMQFVLTNPGKVLVVLGIVTTAATGFVVWIYEKFRVPALTETSAQLKESNSQLKDLSARIEKERDELRKKHSDAVAERDSEKERVRSEREGLVSRLEEANRQAETARSTVELLKREHDKRIHALQIELSKFRISGRQDLPISALLSERPISSDGGRLLFNGKLALPPLSAEWVQVSHSDGTEGTFKGGDLGIFQRMTQANWKAIERSLPGTLRFNEMHPPNIWTTAASIEESLDGWLMPYIQVSLISHTDAVALMRSVRDDIQEVWSQIQHDIKEVFEGLHFDYQPQQTDQPPEELAPKAKWTLLFERSLQALKNDPAQRLRRLVDAILPDGDRLTFSLTDEERLEQVTGELEETIGLYVTYPLLMLRNCVASLGKMPPETGLMIGRLLYYVFGVAKGGKIDIQQLSSSYEGAFARVRIETPSSSNEKGDVLVTNDYVLILATKSDFCLVHVHIPLRGDAERNLDVEAQNWIRNIRMALLR